MPGRPPRRTQKNLYLQPGGGLSFEAPTDTSAAADTSAYAEYVSDPDAAGAPHAAGRHLPGTTATSSRTSASPRRARTSSSLSRRCWKRTSPLTGELFADLYVSTTGTDADFIVKLIDVYPGTARCELPDAPCSVPMGGFEQMVRGEVMRARFRNSFERPEALVPGEVTQVRFDMQDVAHTFRTGHRMMVQVQSSWFPMVDLNPQRFVDIPHASPADRQVATHRVYLSPEHPSHLEVKLLD